MIFELRETVGSVYINVSEDSEGLVRKLASLRLMNNPVLGEKEKC